MMRGLQSIKGLWEFVQQNISLFKDINIYVNRHYRWALLDGIGALGFFLSGKTMGNKSRQGANEGGDDSPGLFPWMCSALDHLEEIVLVCNAKGHVEYANRAFQLNSGYTPRDVIGRRPDFFLDLSGKRKEIMRSVRGMRKNDVLEFQLNIRTKHGNTFESSVFVTAYCTEPDIISHYICISQDLSRERLLQRQLHEVQRMESMGTLSRGIAHRFNNVLGSITGQLELWEAGRPLDEFSQQRAKRILQAVENGQDLVAQIKTFSNRETSPSIPADLPQLIHQTIRFIKSVLPAGVEVIDDIPNIACRVYGEPEDLQQMLLNLFTNALEAIGDSGGKLSVGLKIVDQVIQRHIAGTTAVPERCARIRIADTGTGVDPVHEPHIFEPFFTTKQQRNAAGMGLAVVRYIVERYRGVVHFYSAPEQGAVFEIYLPVHTPDLPESLELLGPRGSGERLLLVDKEIFVTQAGSNLLSGLGYDVTTLNKGKEVVPSLENAAEKFDLLVIDLSLEDLGGLDVVQHLRSKGYQIPVIATTSIDAMPQPWETEKLNIKRVLNKPCPARDLSTAVRDMLDAAAL